MKLRNFPAILPVLVSAVLTWSCLGGGSSGDLSFSSNVAAFTSGHISRHIPICLVLQDELDPDRATPEFLDKAIKITPAVKGTWSMRNSKTAMFKPSDTFARNTEYTVTANISKLLGVKGNEEFQFAFNTLPLRFDASLDKLDHKSDKNNSEWYDATVTIFTPDRESDKLVEKTITLSEDVNAEWSHSDGLRHTLTLTGIKSSGKERNITLSTGNTDEIKPGEILSIKIPGNDFSVYEINYETEPSEHIEVVFTQNLDTRQNMSGLAYTDGGSNERIKVSGNKLSIYPDNTGASATVNLNANIKSAKGVRLGEDLSFKVNMSPLMPSVEFEGDGTIIPRSGKVTIPFSAVYLRGVRVHVIKVFEDNMGQFLQECDIDRNDEIMRVGRLVAIKTIILGNEDDPSLTKRKVYGLDLTDLIEPEPGAIYRIELSFDRDLSVYPCQREYERPTDEQIKAADRELFLKESTRFDSYGSYYYTERNWSYYRYSDRNDPCTDSYYLDKGRGISRNVLVTDIGLIAMAGDDSKMTVLARDISTTLPMGGVKINAYNFQHRQVGHGTTDNDGRTDIELSGKPYYLTASQDKMRSYLKVNDGNALSLSTFDVSGEVVQKGIKGFIYGQRGVWRPGDTIGLGFMLNDRDGKIPADIPVIMSLYTPAGQLYASRTQTKGSMGTYAFSFATEPDAATGNWTAQVNVGGATFKKRIRIETIKPNRLKIELSFPFGTLMAGKTQNGSLHSQWLNGASAGTLRYTIEGTFTKTQTRFDGFKGYVFDDPTKTFRDDKALISQGRLDSNGDAEITIKTDVGTKAPGMLTATLNTTVFEESGDFSIDAMTMRYSPYSSYVGIKAPGQERSQLDTGTDHPFSLVSLTSDGKPKARTSLAVNVYKVKWYWWWNSDDSYLADYTSGSYNSPVLTRSVTTGADGTASFKLNFSNKEWGTYLIIVTDKESGHSTGIMSYFDWPLSAGRRTNGAGEYATLLTVSTDKTSYAPGDKINVSFPSSSDSRAVIAIENGTRLLSVSDHACTDGTTTVTLDATDNMQPTAYISITLLQPHAAANDMPIRMYGVVPVKVISPDSRLEPVITAPDKIEPESQYTVTVSEKSGTAMSYTIAVVDEGLLDLTRFATPDPFAAFNAREALGVNTWDIYKYVAGAYGGRISRMFSIGGDDALESGAKTIVNRFTPVALFEGPFTLSAGQKQSHTFKMPNYNGRVRVMVVAGNGKAYGNAHKSIMVNKPVMLLGTLPRTIGVGEEMEVPATVFATEDGIGTVNVTIECSENMKVTGASKKSVSFDKAGDKIVSFRIKTGDTPGKGSVKLTAKGKGQSAVYHTEIDIRSVSTPVTTNQTFKIEPSGKLSRKIELPGDAGTGTLTLELSDIPAIDLSRHLSYLIDYPHGCIEQITSKAFPQLYLPKLTDLTMKQAAMCQNAVTETIRRMRSYQTSDGSFGYWPGSSDGNAWGTVYAVHFLTEAAAAGYDVPAALKKSALGSIRRQTSAWHYNRHNPMRLSEEQTQAYRLYVLALNGTPDKGAMNRLREQSSLTLTSRRMLAMAYALTGRKDIAKELLDKTSEMNTKADNDDLTFGSPLRDQAVALLAMTATGQDAEAARLTGEIASQLSSSEWLSTQSTAYALLAISKQLKGIKQGDELDLTYRIADKKGTVSTTKHLWSQELITGGSSDVNIEIVNKGKGTVFARVITSGTISNGNVEASSGALELNVRYLNSAGKEVDITRLVPGENFTSVAVVKNTSPRMVRNIVLSQIYPSGWEILNTRYMDDYNSHAGAISYQDIRDDRVYSYIDALPSGSRVTVKINLCAAYSGRFYLPPATCAAMYDNTISSNTASSQVTVE
ncbi:MAG: hypothetical protein K2N21_07450 [Rikenellaceae bacterium]|nr:hypothetical protein [Rikenellaceae bacterium]